jgi:hypothetical protein
MKVGYGTEEWVTCILIRDDFKYGNLFSNVETLVNLNNPSYANYKMFGDIFVKIFKFLRILYSLYKILAIFKVK